MVPQHLAVLLDEIREPLRVDDDRFDRPSVEGHVQLLDGAGKCLGCFDGGQRPDHREPEQPLCVRLRFSRQARELGQTGSHDRDWELSLHGLVQCRNQSLEIDLGEKLHLVEEQCDPAVELNGGLSQRNEQIREVLTEISTVAHTPEGLDIEASRHGPVGGYGQRERLQDARGSLRTIAPPFLGSYLDQGASNELGYPRTELDSLRDLGLDRHPSGQACLFLQRPKEHRLADASESGHQQRLFGPAGSKPR